MNRVEELTKQIRAARLAGDWDTHLRLWEERRTAEVDADEAVLTRQLEADRRYEAMRLQDMEGEG